MSLIKLSEKSTLNWHNILKNPDDLPKSNHDCCYICMVSLEEHILNPDEVQACTIIECLYKPETKEWLELLPVDVCDGLEGVHAYRKPYSNVIMRCNPLVDYFEENLSRTKS